MIIEIDNLEALEDFASKLAKVLKPGEVYTLTGDLGAGKTTLVQKISKALGISDVVTSPTFSIVNIYGDKQVINHLDLYRFEDELEVESFEYEDYFYPRGSTSFIEWPERAGVFLPRDVEEIVILTTGENTREIRISPELAKRLEVATE